MFPPYLEGVHPKTLEESSKQGQYKAPYTLYFSYNFNAYNKVKFINYTWQDNSNN